MNSCKLCNTSDEEIVWQDKFCRFIIAKEKNLYQVHRVIWNDHITELSFLSKKDLNHIFSQLIKAEKYIIEKLQPHKINIASFGNLVPHLHWHIIPRWRTDPWWPNTVWDNVKSLEWLSLKNTENPESNDFICVGDWNNLKKDVQFIRNKVSDIKKKSNSNDEENELDFISRHVLIRAGSKPIATGKLEPNGKIEKITVLKKYRKIGYGRLILKKLISEAANKKLPEVFIYSKNSDSEYYKEQGFITVGKNNVQSNENYIKFTKNIL